MRFHMPTRIIFGSGEIVRLKKIIKESSEGTHPMVVTDKGIIRSGVLTKVFSSWSKMEIFSEIATNPDSAQVNKAGEFVRQVKPDLIIAVGGGSAIDAGKAVALLATNPGVIEQYEGKEKYIHKPLPVVAVPTTCGTGSEVTWVSVITDSKRKYKMGIKGRHMFPIIAVVDPDLLISLPRQLIASTGMDALTHAVEAYTSKPASVITDMIALEAYQLIIDSVESAYENISGDVRARERLMLGSTLAGIAFGNSDIGAVHCIAEAIGALFDIPHGMANAVFLPHVMEFNLSCCANRYAKLASIAGIEERVCTAAAEKLINFVSDLSRSLKIPAFHEIGIEEDEFPKIAKHAFENNSNPSNPQPMGIDEYLTILTNAYHYPSD